MFKKNILGLLLFACFVTTSLFIGATLLINQDTRANIDQNKTYVSDVKDDTKNKNENKQISKTPKKAEAEPWLSTNPSDLGKSDQIAYANDKTEETSDQKAKAVEEEQRKAKEALGAIPDIKLILDSSKVDYMSFIPKMVYDDELTDALDIDNPNITISAKAAILVDADTKEILYHKNAVKAKFSASTVKLLTSLVALDWCSEKEKITIGNEITMIASDSTRAYLKVGEKVTLRNLLEGMLLPSGNDAAYATAAYVGRKSLQNPKAPKKDAIKEFSRLMNEKAEELGAKNSCFKTPDGYDAIGQYTTAYDMGMIGVAAAKNKVLLKITKRSKSRNIFVSGEDVTWVNTNKLISRYSGEYYPYAIGLKTGTSTMAGRCLVAAARRNGKEVVCVIMDSSSAGRWEDAIALLKYGINY